MPIFKEIYVAIDPASHNSSSMGICAIGIDQGTVYLMGLASVRLERADVLQSTSHLSLFLRYPYTNAYTVNKTIVTFIERLREHPGCASAVMLPIIEVNGTFLFNLIQRLALALTVHQRERALCGYTLWSIPRVAALSKPLY